MFVRQCAVQEFVNASFEKRMSTDAALNLLLQFQTILQREALQVSSPLHRIPISKALKSVAQ
jgi:hypothetical protein